MSLPRMPLISSSSSSSSGLLSRSSSVKTLFFRSSGDPLPISFAGSMRHPPPAHRILASLSRSAASSGGGRHGLGAGGDGRGGDTEARSLVGELDEASVLESEVIVLAVGGMSCGGCVASVKRILESQPQVATATVNLETETAVIWVSPDFEVAENWQKQLGEKLASHLTTCGFQSSLKGLGEEIKGEIPS